MKHVRWPVLGVVTLALAAAWAFGRGQIWIGVLLLGCAIPAVIGLVVVVMRDRDGSG